MQGHKGTNECATKMNRNAISRSDNSFSVRKMSHRPVESARIMTSYVYASWIWMAISQQGWFKLNVVGHQAELPYFCKAV